MNTTKELFIPFSGFYESLHDSEIDYTIENMFSDDSGSPNRGLAARVFDSCHFGAERVKTMAIIRNGNDYEFMETGEPA